MKLELHKISVRRICFGEATHVENGLLTVNREELKALIMEDRGLAGVELDLAHPGEDTRIMPVKDALEPRAKLSGPGEVFPGFIGPLDTTVGEGQTLVLEGAAVLTAGRLVAAQEGIVDMSGPGADYTPFSRTANLVLVLTPREGVRLHEAEQCCRLAGLKAAHYLAAECRAAAARADRVAVYDFQPLSETLARHPNLPKVAYVYMLQSQGLLHDTWVYGVDAKRILPTLMSPTEIMDGAIVSGNCVSACDKNNTFSHQNNPIIEALFKRHGTELNFVGVVVTNENVTLADKQRSSSLAIRLVRLLGAEAAIISEEGFGNPDADLILNCVKAEKAGVKTVLVTDEYAGTNGASQSLADSCPEGDAVVTAGNANATIILPAMAKVIGDPGQAEVVAGGFFGSRRPDGSLEVELQAIMGATCELGLSRIGAYTI
ncbi:MAG: glycine/sarcosine/betaine reductase component B subunit [Candidatus Adiutrix sp.]|nr:glycine/sarcosine/betaine reductase component B subunit [Candidatus Adiutrix sp.]